MADTEKMKRFIESIARVSMREELPEWNPDETGISDGNQDLTLSQADWADALIEQAREIVKD